MTKMASLDFVTEESAKTQGMSAQSCQLLAEVKDWELQHSWLWDTKILVYLTMLLTFNTKTQTSSLFQDFADCIPSPLPPKLCSEKNERDSTELIKPVTWGH